MFLARVKGHVVATAKDPSIKGQKLLIVEPLKVDYEPAPAPAPGSAGTGADGVAIGGKLGVTNRAIIALDSVGAGEGQLVLIVQGSSARMAEGMSKVPVDALVVGIVDEAIVMGKKVT